MWNKTKVSSVYNKLFYEISLRDRERSSLCFLRLPGIFFPKMLREYWVSDSGNPDKINCNFTKGINNKSGQGQSVNHLALLKSFFLNFK